MYPEDRFSSAYPSPESLADRYAPKEPLPVDATLRLFSERDVAPFWKAIGIAGAGLLLLAGATFFCVCLAGVAVIIFCAI